MIKASLNELTPLYDKLFNTILSLGIMPLTWCGGLITAIYKSGGRSDPSRLPGCLCLKLSREIILLDPKPKTPRTCQCS